MTDQLETKRYTYSSLGDKTDIRVLELYPGVDDNPLRGHLKHVSLQTKPIYEALSYAWESDVKSHHIDLQSGQLPLTSSLYSALKLLRRSDSPRLIWADALCINQQNNPEKTQQVRLMSEIYQHGQQTIVYLGDGGEPGRATSDRAFSLLRAIQQANFGDEWRHISDEEYVDQGLPVPTHPDWQTCNTMLELPWFQRLWVVQECVVAQKVTMVWNRNEIDFEDFLAALENKNLCGIGPTAEHQSLAATKAFVRLIFISSLRENWATGARRTLARLLSTIDHAQATVPHDNMFALLGLSQESDIAELRPDYDEPLEKTLLRYARYLILTKNSLDILSSSGLSQRTQPSDVPSWVPLWTSTRRESNLALQQPDGTKYFCATGSSQPDLHFNSDSGILQVTGYIFDTISAVRNSRWSDVYHNQATFDQFMFATFADADDVATNAASSSTRTDWNTIIWRNLLFGKAYISGFHVTATADYGPSFEALRKYLDYVSQNDWRTDNLPENIGQLRNLGEAFYADFWTTRYLGLCATQGGRVGRIPVGSEVGDVLAVFMGAATPFVLREDTNRPGYYRLIGECYVHEAMHGGILTAPGFCRSTINLC